MDTKTLIHVGVEVVVIGGIVFNFQRKMNKLEGENQALRDENTKLKGDIEKIYKILNMHDQILSGKLRPSDVYARESSSHVNHSHRPPPPHTSYHINQPSPPPPTQSTPQPPPEEEIPEEEEPNEEELDTLLKEELSDLKTPSPNFIEIECGEETPSKKSSKKKAL